MLQHLENTQILQEYHNALYQIFGIPIDYVNIDGKLFAHFKSCNPLCELIRSTPYGNKCCAKSDDIGLRVTKATKTQQTYICHAGLIDVMVPLFVRGIYAGALCTGQIFESPPTEEKFKAFISNNAYLLESFSIEEIKEKYFTTRYLEVNQINGVVKLLNLVSNYIISNEMQLNFLDSVDEQQVTKIARDYIKQHSHEKLTVNSIAKKVNLSTSHFGHIFKRDTSYSPVTYLNRCRIKRAMEMLKNTNRSVGDIAFMCGFQNLTHFNRTFRQFNSETPREYRKRQNV